MMHLNRETLYSIGCLNDILFDFPAVKTSKKIEYINVASAFDIETSSFEQGNRKMACMYCYVFGIDGNVVFGRTWDEVITIFKTLQKRYDLSERKRLVVYIHNLAYEFQWMCYRMRWLKVFATEERKPLTALCEYGIEFRCSYMLTGMSLAKVGENLTKYKISKLVGDLDYTKMRHSKTPMTTAEIGYAWNDALVVMARIQEEIEKNRNNISLIPLTKTGYVRRRCRENCLYPLGHTKANVPNYYKYQKYIRNMRIETPEMYAQCKRAFQGGFTHTNSIASGVTQHDVTSYDFTSSYPSVLIAERYPISTPKTIQIKSNEDFKRYIDHYACIFDVTFVNIKARYLVDNPISVSKCFVKESVYADNGRVYQAGRISMTITNIDYKTIKLFYKWDRMFVSNFKASYMQYLPTQFVKTILDFYWDKTTLKDVAGKETEYLASKELLNSTYGMCVTDIIQDENTFDENGWVQKNKDVVSELERYNESRDRYLYYLWGVFCTAYARKNLYSGIAEFGNIANPSLGSDYIYSDTDSVKVINADRHKGYIDEYNRRVILKLERAMAFHNLPAELIKPKTIEGKEKPLGVWDFDGHYLKAKFLRAKCYLVQKDSGKYSLTVSGLNKQCAVPFLERLTKFVKTKPSKAEIRKFCERETYKSSRLESWVIELVKEDIRDIFDLFSDDMYIPPEHTGKNIHTYVDDPCEGAFIDYLGNVGEFKELSYVHLEGCEYSLSITDEYIRFLNGVREDRYG